MVEGVSKNPQMKGCECHAILDCGRKEGVWALLQKVGVNGVSKTLKERPARK